MHVSCHHDQSIWEIRAKMRPNVSRPWSSAGDGAITGAVIEEAHFAKGT